ncbi:MAG: TonB-dependent receptor [Phenylobacterium sp.]|uniref:TonB-dependent receptor n=1 Tax=Phenylobacterium sp. TaxID=1871053 RepID=UPI001A638276|nr:TonB-dependent receptor [Phenylobacterium sp.]MBL8772414.1 TonB-dependent receptor [Phenylobacterium sp.]
MNLTPPRRTIGGWRGALAAGVALAPLAALPAQAQTAEEPVALTEIVVTAQKRAETANTVPMSITAVSGEQLAAAGVTQPRDLVKIAPSFNYTDSYVASPIYTLRGVGFSDVSLGGRSTVSIYQDEAPIPFAIETRGVNLDLERIEVLKGPQGTLFGQNATGGAINYIAAKPTRQFEAGADVGYGRFDATELGGFVSGPLTETLSARLAVQSSRMDPWQTSYTTGERNGRVDLVNARLIVAWTPAEATKVLLTVGGWRDRSDVQAGQLIGYNPAIPAAAPLVPGLLTYPLAPPRARAADFTPGLDYARSNRFFQSNLRIDQELPLGLTLTSLTSYSRFRERQLQDTDGTTLANLDLLTRGHIQSVSQELRVGGPAGERVTFVAGVNLARDTVLEDGLLTNPQSTVAFTFVPFGLPLFTSFRDINNQHSSSWAAFVSGDVALAEGLKAYGGLRYTRTLIRYDGCSADAGDGVTALDFGALLNVFRAGAGLPPNPPIPRGGCYTADAQFRPGLVRDKLDEDNVAWRAGLEWTPAERTLLYANVSKGYKAGSFPSLGATLATQLGPAKQESILAYEAGFKVTLQQRTLQLNGAVFHYAYDDKQVLGKVLDPVFGPLLKLVNVPKSRLTGAELEVAWAPVRGLRVTGGGSWIDSEIRGPFLNFDPAGALRDFGGESFPNTPKWHLVGDIDYRWNLNDALQGFVGASATHQSATNSQLGELPILRVRAHTLVDLRAGVGAEDGAWRLTAWGRNVGDVYYWTSANRNLDTTVRFAGMPATYGVTLSLRTR